jgi:hypothetical protein
MNLFACVSIVTAAVAFASPVLAGSSPISGNWSGDMRQIDIDRESKYPMTLTLQGNKGTSSYPTLKCGGVWSRIGETKEGYTIFKEKVINEPGGTCIDGIAVVHAYAGKLVLGMFNAYEGAPGLASAVLAKE